MLNFNLSGHMGLVATPGSNSLALTCLAPEVTQDMFTYLERHSSRQVPRTSTQTSLMSNRGEYYCNLPHIRQVRKARS